MFDFSIGELGVIFAVALIAVGPKKLPQVARAIGKGLGSLKKSLDEVKGQVQAEFNEIKDTSGIKEALDGGAELKKSLQNIKEQARTDLKETIDSPVTELSVNHATKNTVE